MDDIGILSLLILALFCVSAYYREKKHLLLMERIGELESNLKRAMRD